MRQWLLIAATSFELIDSNSVRNKDQKLVSCFLEIWYVYRLVITVLLKMYRKYGQPKWILVGQMLKMVRKWLMADCYFKHCGNINTTAVVILIFTYSGSILCIAVYLHAVTAAMFVYCISFV